jgi:hypothetical protein
MRGLPVSPGSRGIRSDSESIREQLGASFPVERQDYEVDFFATELSSHTAAIQGHCGWRGPVASIPAGNESASVAHANHYGAFFESGNDRNAIGTGELVRAHAVPGRRHRIENSRGPCEPCRRVIGSCRGKSCGNRQEQKVLCF